MHFFVLSTSLISRSFSIFIFTVHSFWCMHHSTCNGNRTAPFLKGEKPMTHHFDGTMRTWWLVWLQCWAVLWIRDLFYEEFPQLIELSAIFNHITAICGIEMEGLASWKTPYHRLRKGSSNAVEIIVLHRTDSWVPIRHFRTTLHYPCVWSREAKLRICFRLQFFSRFMSLKLASRPGLDRSG